MVARLVQYLEMARGSEGVRILARLVIDLIHCQFRQVSSPLGTPMRTVQKYKKQGFTEYLPWDIFRKKHSNKAVVKPVKATKSRNNRKCGPAFS